MLDESGNRFAFVTDQVGSVRQVVEVSTGAVVQSMRYTAFGEVLEDEDFSADFPPQPFGYAGGLYDRETGFVRFGARDYEAATRRWTAKDPIRFGGGDTNLFAYVGNDPVESVDPEGLQSDKTVSWMEFWVKFAQQAGPAVERGVGPAAVAARAAARAAQEAASDAAAAALAAGIGACLDLIASGSTTAEPKVGPITNDDMSSAERERIQRRCSEAYGVYCPNAGRGQNNCHLCMDRCLNEGGVWPRTTYGGLRCRR